MKILIPLLIVILTMSSCQSSEKEQIITVENKFVVSVPSFLTPVNNLNEGASLQYQHAWKEFYVIVFDEPKIEMHKALSDYDLSNSYSTDVNGYTNLLMDNYEKVISISNRSDVVDTLVNNMPAKILSISGRSEGIDAYYTFGFIEGKERYYQVMAWTLSSKEHEYKDKMRQIIYSLKEL